MCMSYREIKVLQWTTFRAVEPNRRSSENNGRVRGDPLFNRAKINQKKNKRGVSKKDMTPYLKTAV